MPFILLPSLTTNPDCSTNQRLESVHSISGQSNLRDSPALSHPYVDQNIPHNSSRSMAQLELEVFFPVHVAPKGENPPSILLLDSLSTPQASTTPHHRQTRSYIPSAYGSRSNTTSPRFEPRLPQTSRPPAGTTRSSTMPTAGCNRISRRLPRRGGGAAGFGSSSLSRLPFNEAGAPGAGNGAGGGAAMPGVEKMVGTAGSLYGYIVCGRSDQFRNVS